MECSEKYTHTQDKFYSLAKISRLGAVGGGGHEIRL